MPAPVPGFTLESRADPRAHGGTRGRHVVDGAAPSTALSVLTTTRHADGAGSPVWPSAWSARPSLPAGCDRSCAAPPPAGSRSWRHVDRRGWRPRGTDAIPRGRGSWRTFGSTCTSVSRAAGRARPAPAAMSSREITPASPTLHYHWRVANNGDRAHHHPRAHLHPARPKPRCRHRHHQGNRMGFRAPSPDWGLVRGGTTSLMPVHSFLHLAMQLGGWDFIILTRTVSAGAVCRQRGLDADTLAALS